MKFRNLIILMILPGLILSLIFPPSLVAQEKKQEKKEQKPDIIVTPEKLKSIFKEGIETREARLDIPFSIIWHIYLPAQQNMHSIFYFRVKNEDFDFSPITPKAESPEKKQEKEIEKTPPDTETSPPMLQARSHIFLQFNCIENNIPKELVKEVYIPFNLQVDRTTYEPEKKECYSTAYPLPPGNYLLSMAIASADLERIGTQYFEFSLPDALSFTEELGTTPIFFIRETKKMPSPETIAKIHKDFFTYSVRQIKPYIENLLSVGKSLEILFFIFGAIPDKEGKYNIDVNYELLKGEEKVMRYATAHYDSHLIIQLLPMKKIVLIKSEEGEKKEQRDLEPGKYTLSINIEDKVSGNSIKKSVDFDLK